MSSNNSGMYFLSFIVVCAVAAWWLGLIPMSLFSISNTNITPLPTINTPVSQNIITNPDFITQPETPKVPQPTIFTNPIQPNTIILKIEELNNYGLYISDLVVKDNNGNDLILTEITKDPNLKFITDFQATDNSVYTYDFQSTSSAPEPSKNRYNTFYMSESKNPAIEFSINKANLSDLSNITISFGYLRKNIGATSESERSRISSCKISLKSSSENKSYTITEQSISNQSNQSSNDLALSVIMPLLDNAVFKSILITKIPISKFI